VRPNQQLNLTEEILRLGKKRGRGSLWPSYFRACTVIAQAAMSGLLSSVMVECTQTIHYLSITFCPGVSDVKQQGVFEQI